MSSIKLSLNHIIGGFLALIAFSLLIFVGKTIFESSQTALSLDEKLGNNSAPTLNRQLIDKAIKTIGTYETNYVPKIDISEGKDVKGEDKNKIWPKTILITNASGVNGAAGDVKTIFEQNDTDISLETNESLLDETVLLYKNEYKPLIFDWQEKLKEKGWQVDAKEAKNDSQFDIELTLGKQAD